MPDCAIEISSCFSNGEVVFSTRCKHLIISRVTSVHEREGLGYKLDLTLLIIRSNDIRDSDLVKDIVKNLKCLVIGYMCKKKQAAFVDFIRLRGEADLKTSVPRIL